jgi:hypothetical protein
MARRTRKRKPRSAASPASPERRRASGSRPVGARVARVAVDDETWSAFRELCGPTPASVRLADLVRAEVERARSARDPAGDALRSLRVISDQAQLLEDYIRAHARDSS